MPLVVQMRHENGDLMYRDSVEQCMKEAKEDFGIWKISWTDSQSGERIRLVRSGHAWVYEPIILPELGDDWHDRSLVL